ncbi:hypothetical protein [Dyella sp.]|uniref:hypothetical protein n=1 Tax=Dyella sp. TaxID=1869338 RepID=UPI002FDA59F1
MTKLEQFVTVCALTTIGAGYRIAQLLNGSEPLKWRVLIGHAISGAVTSLSAGLAITQFPHMGIMELIGLGAILGIGGPQVIDLLFRRFAGATRGEDK